jgi:phosphoglycerol transferase MdoB-like AlkP superfamily enzyme
VSGETQKPLLDVTNEHQDHGATGTFHRISRSAASLAILISASFALVFMTEYLSRGSFDDIGTFLFSAQRPGLTTVTTVALTLLCLDAVLGRRFMSLFIVAPVLLILGFVSSQKKTYLSDPLYPSDMLFGRQIVELLPAMVRAQPLLAVGLVIGAIALCVAIVAAWIALRRRSKPIHFTGRIARLAFSLPLLLGLGSLMEYSQFSYIRDRLNVIPMMWDQQENYRHNGFLMAFAFNVPMANVSAPYGYSADTIAEITADSSAFAVNQSSRPDVIMIMSESLWDPKRLENVSFNKDPMPNIRKMQSGSVFSPEFGGMTANVEFEALTGFTNAFLPYGSIPYQQYIREPVPSLASFFRAEGYSALAIHPFQEWFWNRKEVYKNFGFEEFLSEDKLPPLEKRGTFASDKALTDQIIASVENADRPMFLFSVTLQGHGPYEQSRYSNNAITVEGPLSDAGKQQLETYSQGVREADIEMKRLVDWAKKRDRETVIVFFGDHLPPLGEAFTSSGYMPNRVATRRAPLDVMKKEHETPLVIWSSKTGIKKDVGSTSPAFLPYHVVKLAGFEDPFYTGMLGDVLKDYSVIDRHMLVDADGVATPDWLTQGSKISPTLVNYRQIQHDMMFGKSFGKSKFFTGFEWLQEATKPLS